MENKNSVPLERQNTDTQGQNYGISHETRSCLARCSWGGGCRPSWPSWPSGRGRRLHCSGHCHHDQVMPTGRDSSSGVHGVLAIQISQCCVSIRVAIVSPHNVNFCIILQVKRENIRIKIIFEFYCSLTMKKETNEKICKLWSFDGVPWLILYFGVFLDVEQTRGRQTGCNTVKTRV